MTINKCLFQTTCLDPLINDEIQNIKDLNTLALKITSSTRSFKKAANKNPLAFSLTEEQTKEIQKKIKQINEKEFPEDFKKRIEALTSHLTQFINQFQKRSKGSDLIQIEKTSLPSSMQGEKAQEALSPTPISRAANADEEIQLQEGEVVFSIENKTGSDCYQNSLCQFLECKTLKEQFVDRLPDNLWREFNRRPIHSKALRNLIRKETDFKHGRGQQDVDELLTRLSDRLNENDLSDNLIQPAKEALPKKKKDEIKTSKTLAQRIRANLFSLILFPFFVWKKAINFLDYCLDKVLGNENNKEEETELVPLNSIVRPQRKLKSDPNPLECTIFELRKWNVSNVPDEFKRHDYFGGENNQRTRHTNELNHLKLPIDESNDFQTLLENYFEEDEESHETSVAQNEPKIEAKYSLTRYYQEEPSSLILNLRRFSLKDGQSRKINSEIQGIPAILKLPSKALNGKEPEKELELQSFIVHLGASLNSGHYICYRKVEGTWYLFNDAAKPQRLSEEKALEAAKNAYLIFYDQIAT
jgi:ubiquitin C-terminal hydrolase